MSSWTNILTKYPSGYPNTLKCRPSKFLMKKTITFWSSLALFSTNGLMVKDQQVKGQGSTTFLEGTSYGVTYDKKYFGQSSFLSRVITASVSFFFFLDPFFDLEPVLRANDGKKPIIFPDAKFYAESFEKKSIKKSQFSQKLTRPWKFLMRPSAAI